MNLTQKHTLSQSQVLSQNQTQSLNILAMNNMELHNYIWEMQLENPVLEVAQNHSSYEEFVTLGQGFKKGEEGFGETNFYNEGPSLKDYLISQLDYSKLTKEEIALFNYLVDSLNEKGYLNLTEDEIVSSTKLPARTVRKCVSLLKSFDPLGIGAYDLVECLCIQARAANASEEVLTLIQEHLDDIASMRYDRISKSMGISIRHLKDCIRFIKQLTSIPSNGFSQERTLYLIPDIILSRQDHTWSVVINDNWIGDIKINSLYQNTLTSLQDPELLDYFEKKINHAKFVIKCIEQRRTTLLQVVHELLKVQEEFFLGTSSLKPLILKNIASHLNIHESTVSRAIKDKYLSCDRGTFLLRDLFVNGLTSKFDDKSISSDKIKKLLKKIIDSENKEKPYSDHTLCELLKSQNIILSRRTIAKYRVELGIGSTIARKNC